jgi:hypothetical protein
MDFKDLQEIKQFNFTFSACNCLSDSLLNIARVVGDFILNDGLVVPTVDCYQHIVVSAGFSIHSNRRPAKQTLQTVVIGHVRVG